MRVEKDTFGLYNRKFFMELLRLERKRTERSKTPFVLIMVNMERLSRAMVKSTIRNLIVVLNDCLREIDVKGWYKEASVIGIICPAVPETMVATLRSKIDDAFVNGLPGDFRSELTVSYTCFPHTEPSSSDDQDLSIYSDLKMNGPVEVITEACRRAMDVTIALTALVVFAPVMLVAALAIKLTSPGPVIFRQERVGLGGRIFTFFKFRSMYVNNDDTVHKEFMANFIKSNHQEGKPETGVFKIVNDCRITPVGRLLRKTSIDELPQLLNVLLGDMSLVGPRPPVPYEVNAYDIWHRRRVMEIKPGITGFWQVYGRSSTSFENMVRMDINYIKSRTLLFDLTLLLKTPFALVKGAY